MSLTQGKWNSICEAEFDYFCTGIGWQDVYNGMEWNFKSESYSMEYRLPSSLNSHEVSVKTWIVYISSGQPMLKCKNVKRNWGNGSINKMLAEKAWGTQYHCQNTYVKAGMTRQDLIPALWKWSKASQAAQS